MVSLHPAVLIRTPGIKFTRVRFVGSCMRPRALGGEFQRAIRVTPNAGRPFWNASNLRRFPFERCHRGRKPPSAICARFGAAACVFRGRSAIYAHGAEVTDETDDVKMCELV